MTDISSIVLNTTTEGRVYDIFLTDSSYNGEKVVVTVFTDAVINDDKNTALKFTSTVEGNRIQIEITDENMTNLIGTDTSAVLQFIVRKGATKVGSKLITLNKEKMVIPDIIFVSDQGNDKKATIIFDISYGSFSPFNSDSALSSVIVEYHIEGDAIATVIEFIIGDNLVITDNRATIIIPNLTNDYLYEYIVTGNNSAGDTNYITGKVRPVDQPIAPAISNIDSIVVGGIPDASDVNITITWQDNDAAGYKSSGLPDGSNSTLKLRIGTDTDISNNQAIYDVSNISQIYEVFLTNAQLGDAVAGLTLEVSNVNIIVMDANASTTGVALKAQMLPASMISESNPGKPGELSTEDKIAFIDTVPTINPIKVAVDASTGRQTFYVNGTFPSQDNSGVSLTIDNSGSRVTDLSGIYVLTDGSLNITEAHTDVSYNDLLDNPIITATLSQVDRNGTLDSGNIYVYSAIDTFKTTRFKTPTNKALFTFTGNKGETDSDLHTQLTDVNNEEFNAFDQSTDASNVVWVLYNDASLNNITVDSTNYTDLSNVDISYNFSPTDAYYLKVVKSCTLAFDGGDYNDDSRKYDDDIVKAETVEDSTGAIYFMKAPTLADITVSLNATTGVQTFTVNGTVPSQYSSGVTLTIDNSGTNVTDLSGTAVLTDGSLNITEASGQQTYIELNNDPVITAILSQVDRNGTLDPNNSYTLYDYAATKTFQAYHLKIPSAPTVTFLGNDTDGADLLTQITSLNNNGDEFDVAATDVRYELVDVTGADLTTKHDVSYTGLNVDNDISYNYTNSQNYYLRATKYASLGDTVAGVYSTDISQNQVIETDLLGPLKATTSASLVLSSIQVSVTASGEQTFYFNGTINSLDASGAKLTMSDGSDNFIDQQDVVINSSGVITEISGSRTYDQLLLKDTITATLEQPDLNGGSFDISANISFNTDAFKTPAAPDATDSLSKNSVGNDGKLQANYQNSDLNDMNGYNLVNVTGVINELADVSGVFNEAVDYEDASYNVNLSANQTIDISGNGKYVVDSSYTMILKKGYALPPTVYSTYEAAQKDTSVTDISAGVIDSTNSNAVFYMGNPEITKVDVSGASDTVTVSVSTHGADLTDDKAVTLVLVAKDGLAGYAGGGLSGNMGSTVLTLDSNDSQVTGYDSVTADSGNQSVIATFDLSNVIITDDATSVIIVDATNAHSAISLSNFPAAIDASFNSSTN
jgi:hypothetical protein